MTFVVFHTCKYKLGIIVHLCRKIVIEELASCAGLYNDLLRCSREHTTLPFSLVATVTVHLNLDETSAA
jgi:hypothetical protein